MRGPCTWRSQRVNNKNKVNNTLDDNKKKEISSKKNENISTEKDSIKNIKSNYHKYLIYKKKKFKDTIN